MQTHSLIDQVSKPNANQCQTSCKHVWGFWPLPGRRRPAVKASRSPAGAAARRAGPQRRRPTVDASRLPAGAPQEQGHRCTGPKPARLATKPVASYRPSRPVARPAAGPGPHACVRQYPSVQASVPRQYPSWRRFVTSVAPAHGPAARQCPSAWVWATWVWSSFVLLPSMRDPRR